MFLKAMTAAAVALSVSSAAYAQAKEQFFPVLVYRTGAYAPNGVPFANGFEDYLKLVNAQGGINGVKLTWEECETGYATDRGVECYERLKGKGPTGATLVHPLSTGITFALTDKVPADKIPLITAGYGRADSADGTVFKWNFPLIGTYWVGGRHPGAARRQEGRRARQAQGQEDRARLPRLALRQGADPAADRALQAARLRAAPAAGDPPGRRAEGDLAADPPAAPGLRVPLGLGRHELDRDQGSRRDRLPAREDVRRVVVGCRARRAARGRGREGLQRARIAAFGRPDAGARADPEAGARQGPGHRAEGRGRRGALQARPDVGDAQRRGGAQGAGALRQEVADAAKQVRWGLENLYIDDAAIKRSGSWASCSRCRPPARTTRACVVRASRPGTARSGSSGNEWFEADETIIKPLVNSTAKRYAAEKKIEIRDCAKDA